MIGFDPLYFLFVGPALILSIWASFKVKSSFKKAAEIQVQSRISGAEAARIMLDNY